MQLLHDADIRVAIDTAISEVDEALFYANGAADDDMHEYVADAAEAVGELNILLKFLPDARGVTGKHIFEILWSRRYGSGEPTLAHFFKPLRAAGFGLVDEFDRAALLVETRVPRSGVRPW